MNILCKVFGHKIIFYPNQDDESCGLWKCKRCKYVQGGVGKVTVMENVVGMGGTGGVSKTYITKDCNTTLMWKKYNDRRRKNKKHSCILKHFV